MEIVVRLDEKTCNLTFLDRLELVQRIQRQVEKLKDVGSSLSAVDVRRPIIGTGPAADRHMGSLGAHAPVACSTNGLPNIAPTSSRATIWPRMMARNCGGSTLRVAASEECRLRPVRRRYQSGRRAAHRSRARQGIRTASTASPTPGLTPLVYKAQHSLLSGLITSFCWAFVMIAAVMAINFRSVTAGLLTMIPTVWPVAVVFGMLGWLGIDIDIGTMMTAGVAMGVCVDDTLHYATWFRRGLRMGLDRNASHAVRLRKRGQGHVSKLFRRGVRAGGVWRQCVHADAAIRAC